MENEALVGVVRRSTFPFYLYRPKPWLKLPVQRQRSTEQKQANAAKIFESLLAAAKRRARKKKGASVKRPESTDGKSNASDFDWFLPRVYRDCRAKEMLAMEQHEFEMSFDGRKRVDLSHGLVPTEASLTTKAAEFRKRRRTVQSDKPSKRLQLDRQASPTPSLRPVYKWTNAKKATDSSKTTHNARSSKDKDVSAFSVGTRGNPAALSVIIETPLVGAKPLPGKRPLSSAAAPLDPATRARQTRVPRSKSVLDVAAAGALADCSLFAVASECGDTTQPSCSATASSSAVTPDVPAESRVGQGDHTLHPANPAASAKSSLPVPQVARQESATSSAGSSTSSKVPFALENCLVLRRISDCRASACFKITGAPLPARSPCKSVLSVCSDTSSIVTELAFDSTNPSLSTDRLSLDELADVCIPRAMDRKMAEFLPTEIKQELRVELALWRDLLHDTTTNDDEESDVESGEEDLVELWNAQARVSLEKRARAFPSSASCGSSAMPAARFTKPRQNSVTQLTSPSDQSTSNSLAASAQSTRTAASTAQNAIQMLSSASIRSGQPPSNGLTTAQNARASNSTAQNVAQLVSSSSVRSGQPIINGGASDRNVRATTSVAQNGSDAMDDRDELCVSPCISRVSSSFNASFSRAVNNHEEPSTSMARPVKRRRDLFADSLSPPPNMPSTSAAGEMSATSAAASRFAAPHSSAKAICGNNLPPRSANLNGSGEATPRRSGRTNEAAANQRVSGFLEDDDEFWDFLSSLQDRPGGTGAALPSRDRSQMRRHHLEQERRREIDVMRRVLGPEQAAIILPKLYKQ